MYLHRILVPVDFSEPSRTALRTAVELAAHFDDADLEIFHVYQPLGEPGVVRHSPIALVQLNESIAEIEEQLARWKEDAEKLGARHVETRSAQGVASTEIVQRAREGDFDLIVIGTHGRSGVKRMLLGSVAERVVRHAECRVMTVHVDDVRPGTVLNARP